MSAKVSAKKSLKSLAILLGSTAALSVVAVLADPAALTAIFASNPKFMLAIPVVSYAASLLLDAWKHKEK